MHFSLRTSAIIAVLLCSGCATYTTPGGPGPLRANKPAAADLASLQPSPRFPASIAVVRVQAPNYKSYSLQGYGSGDFSVVAPGELLTDEQLAGVAKWPSVATAASLDRGSLPPELDSIEDLRWAAAKLQADVLLVYTVDTSFQLHGQTYGPLTSLALGSAPDSDAAIASTASAVFTDVRTGFSYGTVEATAKVSDLGSAWGSGDTVDRKRLEAEHQAFALLLAGSEKTWADILKRYQ